ncbi:hypothetical protein V1514DRAFT_336740 [Lipomyces japonicus]|uniref:mitochondrial 54S ribosomal protein bL35m n=1 Tax=Lipomyces japonicus TaxID=56871 RepID=UPI0034CF5F55
MSILISILRPRMFGRLVQTCLRGPSILKQQQAATMVVPSPAMAIGIRAKHYKIKTHSASAKRWIPRGNGKFKRAAIGVNHGNTGWRHSTKQTGHRDKFATPTQGRRLVRLMPYAQS